MLNLCWYIHQLTFVGIECCNSAQLSSALGTQDKTYVPSMPMMQINAQYRVQMLFGQTFRRGSVVPCCVYTLVKNVHSSDMWMWWIRPL